MASREKKLVTTGRKQTAAVTPSSSDPTPEPQRSEKSSESTPKTSPNKKSIAKRIRRPDTKNVIKKAFKHPLKAKSKINSRNLLNKNKRTVQVKKALIKNGVAKARVVKRKVIKVEEIKEEIVDWDEKPPVLEPIYPLETGKRKVAAGKKKPASFCSISDAIESSIKKGLTTAKSAKPKDKLKKNHTVSSIESIVESIEGVVKCIKVEVVDDEDEEDQSNTSVVEEEDSKVNISKIKQEEPEHSVIDMLDLIVGDVKNKASVSKRRHSIEKFEISNQDDSVFNNLPRCISPRNSKRPVHKTRQSLDSRRSSPYTTRSDSPARILRNGKQRKLKHMNLLDGLDTEYKKRRRLCSDYSGSEVSVSKCSGGYESDSSFSDLASIVESADTSARKESADVIEELNIKKETIEATENTTDETPNESTPNDDLTSKELALKIKKQLAALAKNTEELTKTNDVTSRELALRKELAALAKSNEAISKELAALTKGSDLGLAETSEELALKKELLETLENNPPDSIDISSIPEKFADTIKRSLSLDKEKTFDTNSNVCSDNVEIESHPETENSQPDTILLLDTMKKTFNECTEVTEEVTSDSNVELQKSTNTEESQNKIKSDTEETEKNKKRLKTAEEIGKNKRKCKGNEEKKRKTSLQEQSVGATEEDELTRNPEEKIKRKSSLVDQNVTEQVSSNEEETTKENENKDKILETSAAEEENIKSGLSEECMQTDGGDSELAEEQEQLKACSEIEESEKLITPPVDADVGGEKVLESDGVEKKKGKAKEIENDETEKRRSKSKEEIEETEKRRTRSRDIVENEEVEKRKTRSSVKKDQNDETKEEESKMDSEEDSQDKENFELNKAERMEVEESAEDLEGKNEILRALGLQSLRAAEEAKLRKVVPKGESYTGTLKTVIKLNRHEKKKGRNSLKMTLQKKGKSSSAAGGSGNTDYMDGVEEDEYKIMKESNSSWKSHHGNNSSDTAGAQRKSHYSNRSNMDGSSEHTSDGDTNPAEEGKSLVIPEKASSFSIHPGRLCKDECSYCFGKFGLFDTPCHIAQIKSIERQNKILSTEKHLTRDSCLCDACYRHVDRKSNTPSYTSNKSLKRNSLVAPGPRQNHCHVLGCGRVSSNILKRKWLIKMRKSVCQVINIDLDNPGLHSIPICEEHYAALEHLMVCAMCKRRLARNHIHYLGQESNDLNASLNEMGIPVKLNDKPVVCKLCRYFATLVLKNPEDRNESSTNFFIEYRKRLLHFHDIEVMDESLAEEPIPAPIKEKPEKEQHGKKKKKPSSKTTNNLEPPILEPQVDITESKESSHNRVPSTESRDTSPSEYLIDYNNLIPPENNVEIMRKKPQSITVKRVINISSNSVMNINNKTNDEPRKISDETMKLNEETRKLNDESRKMKLKSDMAVQRLGSNPSISVRQLFPGEEDLQLSGNIEFHNVKERTPEGWEKCVSTIQFDPEVKMLWNELQKPYGNQSSFLRHLILLEKYFRNGDLILSSSATNHSVNYTESVQNRLRAYDNIPSSVHANLKPVTIIPINSGKVVKESKPVPAAIPIIESVSIPEPTQSVEITPDVAVTTNTKVLPVTISQVQIANTSFLVPNPAALTPITTVIPPPPPPPPPPSAIRPTVKNPPGLISIQGKKMPLMKLPQSQKIKFPITKHWRPNLIPVDPAKKSEKKPGLVQVISGGKPYHISIEDYKKMCAIKATFDMRQKRIQDQQKNSLLKNSRKNLIITKTNFDDAEIENSLEKLDKTVEKLEATLSEKSLPMPKIPKSLTVIPQTITKKLPDPTPSTSLLKNKIPTGKS